MFSRLPAAPARRALPALVFAVLIGLTVHATALTTQEAGRVVGLLEQLRPELGPLAYDEDVADDWFERDQARTGLIARAGFTPQGWRSALDATLRGYLANIPQSSIDAMFAQMRQRLEHAPRLTADNRATVDAFVTEERARLEQLRIEGRADAETVRPFTARLRRVLPEAGSID